MDYFISTVNLKNRTYQLPRSPEELEKAQSQNISILRKKIPKTLLALFTQVMFGRFQRFKYFLTSTVESTGSQCLLNFKYFTLCPKILLFYSITIFIRFNIKFKFVQVEKCNLLCICVWLFHSVYRWITVGQYC